MKKVLLAKEARELLNDHSSDIIKMAKEGTNISDIVKHYNVSPYHMKSFCKKENINLKAFVMEGRRSLKEQKVLGFKIKDDDKAIVKQLKVNPRAIRNLNDKDYSLCLASVAEDGLQLRSVKESNKTLEMINAAFRSDRRSIKHIPNKLKTYKMCLRCIEENPDLLPHVPLEFINRKNGTILEVALKQGVTDLRLLDASILKDLSFEHSFMSVDKNYLNIKNIPEKFRVNEDILTMAILKAGFKLKTEEKTVELKEFHNKLRDTLEIVKLMKTGDNEEVSLELNGGLKKEEVVNFLKSIEEKEDIYNQSSLGKTEDIIRSRRMVM